MYNLKNISSTVRPGRKGPIVAKWIADIAEKTGNFNVEVLDLGEVNLPLMNEPHHPILRKYEHEHSKHWSAKIEEADAFVFVTAEYDYSYPAPLKNALEYLVHEWGYKAAGIVSYGGVSAGTRAAHLLKNDLGSLRMVAISEMVNIPFFDRMVNEQHELVPNEIMTAAADKMLKQVVRWTKGLQMIKADV